MLKNVYMYQIVFMTTIDTMLFSVSFTEILTSYGSFIRSWTLEPESQLTLLEIQSTGKITWMKFKPDLALQTLQEEHMCDLIVFAVLYYMAYDILKQTMYSMY